MRALVDADRIRELMHALGRGLVTTAALRTAFDEIAPRLYRYPAVDPDVFRRGVEAVTGGPW